jgi:hypothetical protein
MNALGLSDAQRAERTRRLHAGDAQAIMAGDYRRVFRRIKGLDPEDDLSGEFRVQLGSYTEPFNLAWTMQQTGRNVDYYSDNKLNREIWMTLTGLYSYAELIVSKAYPFMACNLDGLTVTPQGHRSVIDAKHVGRATEQEILRYTPAGVWQATCAETDWWGLSWIVGNKWEEPTFQEVDPLYQATMIARATECWGYIERNEEPPEAEIAPVLAPKPQPRLRSIVVPVEQNDEVYQALVKQNNWLSEARRLIYAFVGTHAAATHHAIVREDIKKLVPEDVGELTCGRYRYARSKAGSVTQSLKPMEKDDETHE